MKWFVIATRFMCWALLSAAPAASEAAREAVVVATVNEEAIHLEDVERQLAAMHASVEEVERADFSLDRLMFRLISDTLIAQEARALGMHEEAPIPRRLQERREEMARQRLETEEIWSRVEVTEEEIRRVFEDSYRTVTFRILTMDERALAEELTTRVDSGEELEALSSEWLASGTARRQIFEEVPRVDIPQDIANVALTLQPGEIGGPFLTNLGWSVVRVDAYGAAEPEMLAKFERRIRSLIRYDEAEALSTDLAARLQRSIEVTVDRQAADIACQRLPDGRLRPQIEHPEAVVARIGNRAITAQAFGTALSSRWRSMRSQEAALLSRDIVLDRLIEYELLTAEAVRRGYDRTPDVEREINAYLKELLVPRYLKEVLAKSIEISEKDKRSFYEENRDRFRRLPRFRLGQVTVEALDVAEKVVTLLRQNADLAWVAKTYSVDEFKDAGGDRGWIVPTREFGDLREELLASQPGAVLGPFPEDEGRYLVLRVDAREEQGHYAFDEVSGNVREAVYTTRFRQRLDEVLGALRERSEIVVNDEVLASLQLSGSVSEPRSHGSPNNLPAEPRRREDGD